MKLVARGPQSPSLRPARGLRIALAGLLWLLYPWSGADAFTWEVTKDASGHFSKIQDALDMAAPGDTVLIGPGIWQDVFDERLPGGVVTLMARVENDITIMGAGADKTTLRPPSEPDRRDSFYGIVNDLTAPLHVRSIRFERFGTAIESSGPAVVIENCVFDRNFDALVSWSPDSTRVRHCSFYDTRSTAILVFNSLGAKDVLIEDCEFEDGAAEILLQSKLPGIVRRCNFVDSTVGVNPQLGGEVRVEDCRFTSILNDGVALGWSSYMELFNCRFQSGRGTDVYLSDYSHLVGSRNVLGGGAYQTIWMLPSATLDFHGNHILNRGGYSVNLGGTIPPGQGKTTKIFDLSNNYWGTTDLRQIDEWIIDQDDSPYIDGFVEFRPILQQPIAVETKSFSQFKLLFGGH